MLLGVPLIHSAPISEGSPPTQCRSVLVVEDDLVLAGIVEDGLIRMGYETRVANNLAAGFNFVQERLPELWILDLSLPDGRGWTLLHDIRDRCPESDLPQVLVGSAEISRSDLKANRIGHHIANRSPSPLCARSWRSWRLSAPTASPPDGGIGQTQRRRFGVVPRQSL